MQPPLVDSDHHTLLDPRCLSLIHSPFVTTRVTGIGGAQHQVAEGLSDSDESAGDSGGSGDEGHEWVDLEVHFLFKTPARLCAHCMIH